MHLVSPTNHNPLELINHAVLLNKLVVKVTLHLSHMLQLSLILTDPHKRTEKTNSMFFVQPLHSVNPTPSKEVLKRSK